jgi:hypothetical protein
VLTNDEKTRTFLCVEVGAGHKQASGLLTVMHRVFILISVQMQELSQSLSSHLASLRQLPYYSQPRFHISIAWILTPALTASNPPPDSTGTIEHKSAFEAHNIDQFLADVTSSIKQLQNTFSKRLLALGRLDVRSLEVKVGKEIHKWPLSTPP